jgi:tetratricopeptide (TPR) repeat protein
MATSGAAARPQTVSGPSDLASLEDAVRRHPESPEAHRDLARYAHQTGQLERAIAGYESAIRLDRSNVDLYVALAGVYRTANLMVEAEAVLSRTLDAFPEAVTVGIELAEVRFGAGRVEEALDTFGSILPIAAAAGQRAVILRRIGDMQTQMIRFDDALASYAAARAVDAVDPDLNVALGKLYLRRNRIDEALEAFVRVNEREPRNTEALEGRIEAHLRVGRYASAVALAEDLLAFEPDHLAARYLRATAMVRAGNADAASAMEEYRELENRVRAVEQREREIGGVYKAALAETLAGNGERAVELLRDGLQVHPDAGELHLNLGLTLSGLGRYDEAAAVFRSMLAAGLGDADLVARSLTRALERRDSGASR